MLQWLRAFFGRLKKVRVLPPGDSDVADAYVEAGLDFGSAVSDVGTMGECVGFEKLLEAFEKAEEAYASRGYRTLSIDAFVEAGGWNKPLAGLLEKRASNEEPIYHGRYYRETYLGKVRGFIQMNWDELQKGSVIAGSYARPSTEHLLLKKGR